VVRQQLVSDYTSPVFMHGTTNVRRRDLGDSSTATIGNGDEGTQALKGSLRSLRRRLNLPANFAEFGSELGDTFRDVLGSWLRR
jgi:hypothetical protein